MFPLKLYLNQLKKPHHLSEILKKKLNLYHCSKNDPWHISAFKAKSKEYDGCVRKCYDDETSICKNLPYAKLYNYINKKIHAISSIPTIKSEDNSLVSLDEEKADLFNLFFKKYLYMTMVLISTLTTTCPDINRCRTLK